MMVAASGLENLEENTASLGRTKRGISHISSSDTYNDDTNDTVYQFPHNNHNGRFGSSDEKKMILKRCGAKLKEGQNRVYLQHSPGSYESLHNFVQGGQVLQNNSTGIMNYNTIKETDTMATSTSTNSSIASSITNSPEISYKTSSSAIGEKSDYKPMRYINEAYLLPSKSDVPENCSETATKLSSIFNKLNPEVINTAGSKHPEQVTETLQENQKYLTKKDLRLPQLVSFDSYDSSTDSPRINCKKIYNNNISRKNADHSETLVSNKDAFRLSSDVTLPKDINPRRSIASVKQSLRSRTTRGAQSVDEMLTKKFELILLAPQLPDLLYSTSKAQNRHGEINVDKSNYKELEDDGKVVVMKKRLSSYPLHFSRR